MTDGDQRLLSKSVDFKLHLQHRKTTMLLESKKIYLLSQPLFRFGVGAMGRREGSQFSMETKPLGNSQTNTH